MKHLTLLLNGNIQNDNITYFRVSPILINRESIDKRDILWRDLGMNELMEKDLENAKKDLKDKQEKLQWFMEHEINSERFEYNMITVLTEMTGLKKKIKTLEFYLSYK